jgi:hypothetical protein
MHQGEEATGREELTMTGSSPCRGYRFERHLRARSSKSRTVPAMTLVTAGSKGSYINISQMSVHGETSDSLYYTIRIPASNPAALYEGRL